MERTLPGLKEIFRNKMILHPKPLQRESFFWHLLNPDLEPKPQFS
jgi:hypothetical protein